MQDYHTARGWLTLPEREAIREYACAAENNFEDPKIVNVGVEYGASLYCLRDGAPVAEIYGIDLDISKFDGTLDVELIRADSHGDEVDSHVPSGLALVFLDADHSEEGLTADIKKWARRVKSGGYLLFHDYSDWEVHAGVVAAVDAWYDRVNTWEFLEQVDTLRVYRRI
jgi:SAM-dependent methyltransferase